MRVVGLGHNCGIANFLKYHLKTRHDAQVDIFDGMFTNSTSKLADLLLSNGVQLFAQYEKLDFPWNENWWGVRCKAYEIDSVHDFLKDKSEEEMIHRLRIKKKAGLLATIETIQKAHHLLLLRSNIKGTKPEDTIYLYDAIKKIRTKPFKMYVFQDNDHEVLNSIPEMRYINIPKASNEGGNGWIFPPQWGYVKKEILEEFNVRSPLLL